MIVADRGDDVKRNYEFLIGVTGHRDVSPEHIPLLEQAVYDLLREIIVDLPFEEITVLSSLAEGADQLCARAALAAGLSLTVPLPMDACEYRKDFSEERALEFDRLCGLADNVFAVTPGENIPAEPNRGFYYRQAGLYVAKRCHILLALWDGVKKETADGAGTYETIKLALDISSIKEVWQIVTPRENSMPDNVFSVVQLTE